jgi:hypothetical protein
LWCQYFPPDRPACQLYQLQTAQSPILTTVTMEVFHTGSCRTNSPFTDNTPAYLSPRPTSSQKVETKFWYSNNQHNSGKQKTGHQRLVCPLKFHPNENKCKVLK